MLNLLESIYLESRVIRSWQNEKDLEDHQGIKYVDDQDQALEKHLVSLQGRLVLNFHLERILHGSDFKLVIIES